MSGDFELREEEVAVLGRIIGGRRAWVAGLGGTVVERLVEVGFVVRWERDAWGRSLVGGPYTTLTPWGAERLGVELRERHWVRWDHYSDHYERVLVEEPYWARVNGHTRSSFVLPHQARQCGLDYPELVPDPAPGPEYLVNEDGKPITFLGGYKARIDHRLAHH